MTALRKTISGFSEKIRAASLEKRYLDSVKMFDELRSEFQANPPPESEVIEFLEGVYKSTSLSDAHLGLMAAWFNLSSSYVPILCMIVNSEHCQSIHELAVELLAELKDARAIDVLKKAVSYRWDYDEWLHVPRKALLGLFQIGGDEALEVIRKAVESDEEQIRNEAIAILDEVES